MSERLSVIVPTWRRPEDLRRCLLALARQSRPADEVVVVTRAEDEPSREIARVCVCAPTELRLPVVTTPGVVAALQAGLDQASGSILVLTDDDAEGREPWLAAIESALVGDPSLGGIGGRDWQPHERSGRERVGIVQWFGRVIGNHHLGIGPARDVDLLKGVNCAFRGELLRAVGFDERLLGSGAQLHWEMGVCLPLRRAGWRLRYDPAIAIDHHVAPRDGADQRHRGVFAEEPLREAVHNETLLLAEHLRPFARLCFRCWAFVFGTWESPGLANWLRLRLAGAAWADAAFRATRIGRAAGFASARGLGRRRTIPAPGWHR